jgi:hypothetical protein
MSLFSTIDKSFVMQQIAYIKKEIENKKKELTSPYASPQQKASIRKYIADRKATIANLKQSLKH